MASAFVSVVDIAGPIRNYSTNDMII